MQIKAADSSKSDVLAPEARRRVRLRRPSPLSVWRVLSRSGLIAVVIAGVVGSSPKAATLVVACDPLEGPNLNTRFNPIGGVALGSGSFQLSTIDIGSRSLAGTFRRAYFSVDTRVTLLGPGWMNNFQVRLRSDGTSRDMLFVMPSGETERFPGGLDGQRTFGTSRGYRVLTHQSDGRLVVRDDRITWTFDSAGNLIRVDNDEGDWAEVSYVQGILASTAGPGGAGLRFEMGPGGRLQRVTATASGQSVGYEYDSNGRLVRAAPSLSAPRRFVYLGATQQITAITDDQGTTLLSLDYDELGRVVRERDASGLLDGEGIAFIYDRRADKSVRTIVTYPPSLVEPGWHPLKIANIDRLRRLTRLEVQPTSERRYVGRYDYDDQNRRIAVDKPCVRPGNVDPDRDVLIASAG
jgi:YD repeat-containing protein